MTGTPSMTLIPIVIPVPRGPVEQNVQRVRVQVVATVAPRPVQLPALGALVLEKESAHLVLLLTVATVAPRPVQLPALGALVLEKESAHLVLLPM